ncbi:yippee-like protein [Chaetomidium leptoderma]|uniref:Yippee-like protein n=1 Tax=Chaetomidium leptoderma TaxID=669021 RepID=A0AAN6VHW3_9PEZI|nr:yippee-like protein [Chaetomidium leptoderma]
MLGDVMSLRRPSASAAPSASQPTFPRYLLPSLRIPFSRRQPPRIWGSPPSPTSAVPSLSTSPTSPISPNNNNNHRLSRTHPTTLRCSGCSTDLAFQAQIISKGFMGRHGRAYLVSPPPPPPTTINIINRDQDHPAPKNLVNIRVGKPETRQLVTGAHVVSDITCAECGALVGWKYVDARDPAQRYKVGKFILETRRVVGFHSWEDIDVPAGPLGAEQGGGEEEEGEDYGAVVFDSEDEEECEEIFSGVWDAKVVAKRRESRPRGYSKNRG